MRAPVDKSRVQQFLSALGQSAKGPGKIYLTGGATALLYGWRSSTIDIDIKADPEPIGLFEAIAHLKNHLDVNVKLAAPDQFIPEVAGWRDRSPFIARHGSIDFYHYDIYSQALAKAERRHERDLRDIEAMIDRGLVQKDRLWAFFVSIEPALIRYPTITPATFRSTVSTICQR